MIAPGERPQPGPARDYQFPRFTRRGTGNSITVLHSPVRRVPIVTVIAVLDGGAADERRDELGLAALTARGLLEGTAHRSGDQLIEAFEELGASIDAAADWDATIVSLTVGAENFIQAFRLLGETIGQPAFPDRGIARLKAERLAELEQIKAEPRGLADEMFSRFVYTDSARYALPAGGTSESVAALTADDARRYHDMHYRASRMTLIVVGDVDEEAAHSASAEAFGEWSTKESSKRPAAESGQGADAERSALAMIRLISKLDAPQSELRIGHRGIPRRDPDYFPAVVMNAILGGLFSSRINLNLREVHGYTYGASSYFDWRRGSGPFVISAAVATDVTPAAIAETLAEVQRMREEPVSGSELSLATSYLAGVFPVRYETTAAIAHALASLVIYGLPDNYFDTYRDSILNVSEGDVQTAAQKLLRPDGFQILIVGQANELADKLTTMNLGPVSVHSPDEF